MAPLIRDLHAQIAGTGASRCELLGVSAGALFAYALAHELRKTQRTTVAALTVVSMLPPGRRNAQPVRLWEQSDEELMDALDRLGGLDDGALRDSRLRKILLPVIRADIQVEGTYNCPSDSLDIPIRAFVGARDPDISAQQMAAWQDCTTADVEVTTYDGGHYPSIAAARSILGLHTTYPPVDGHADRT